MALLLSIAQAMRPHTSLAFLGARGAGPALCARAGVPPVPTMPPLARGEQPLRGFAKGASRRPRVADRDARWGLEAGYTWGDKDDGSMRGARPPPRGSGAEGVSFARARSVERAGGRGEPVRMRPKSSGGAPPAPRSKPVAMAAKTAAVARAAAAWAAREDGSHAGAVVLPAYVTEERFADAAGIGLETKLALEVC